MRAYIRHPSDVPIEFIEIKAADPAAANTSSSLIQDVSQGGLCFGSQQKLEVGSRVSIRIPLVSPPFEAEARVVWCLSRSNGYENGIEFTNSDDAYSARMVEQICHIEHYRLWVKEVEGRDIPVDVAANEWIGKYAKDFPSIA